jgi:hypothetical protein
MQKKNINFCEFVVNIHNFNPKLTCGLQVCSAINI